MGWIWLKDKFGLASCPQDYPQVRWFSRRNYRTKHIFVAVIYYGKGYKAKSTKEKAHGAKSRGLMESHYTCSVVPAVSSNNTCDMLTTKKIDRYSVPRFLSGAGHVNRHIPKFQTHRRKAVAQHKLCCSYKQFRPSESLISVLGTLGTLPQFKCLDASQGSTL